MKRHLILVLIIPLFLIKYAYSQTVPKNLKAVRTDKSIKVDGLFDDEGWKAAAIGTDFIEAKPVPGRKERSGQSTEVRILYDDAAIYIAARMNDVYPDSIAKQVVPRDQGGNADYFGIFFDTYLDKINATGFFVTAAGSQFDAKYSQNGEDENWNAVWFSAVKIDKSGWSAEFKIPYSALRFSSKDLQTWGINFLRRRQKSNEEFFWNPVDPKVSGLMNQAGELTNISSIKAPLRLSLSPYLSNNINNYPYNKPGIKNTTTAFNGGMDVKYGINNAFTLDLTLVPDFGQVQSDYRILNLSPFEVKFNENRQFFTEGTELFNKGDLFYSRRIGSFPAYIKNINSQLSGTEKIVKGTSESKLINATKISGRTSTGLGIGVFNAVTNNMFSTVRDDAGLERQIENQPLTNYNIIVLDQSLKNNSSATFLNTNVLREGSAYDANVSAFLFQLNNKGNKYFVSGGAKMSHLTNSSSFEKPENGTNFNFKTGKKSGNFRFDYEFEMSDEKYNPGDLGFFRNNNFLDHEVEFGYSIYKPGKWYNEMESYMEISYEERYKNRAYQSFGIYTGGGVVFKNFWRLNINGRWEPEGNDFYESRRDGSVFRQSSNYGINANFNTNRSKKYHLGGYVDFQKQSMFDARGLAWGTWQTYRINDKFSVRTEMSAQPRLNYAGWVDNDGGNIIFSRYDRQTVEAVFSTKYTFTPVMGISLRARHYWSERENRQFYSLNPDGSLSDYPLYSKNKNQNYNVFNVDMIYTWQFAPGSELSVAYKDAGENSGNILQSSYVRNFSSTINSPQNNSLSVKILYYLDYLQFKKKKSQ
ncbi:MAG TPA: DUF5916 domain-containing protein [Sphingobacteriaceae bacterium]|nr:DUF5916 domain-containing protein [Sphingobacteriaceae bacterium]